MPAEAPTTTSASATGGKRCPKCGKGKKSGKLSCCARGGAWFQKCGDGDDSNFDHTWMEGIQACNNFGSLLPNKGPVRSMLLHEQKTTQPINNTWLGRPFKQHANGHPTGNILKTDTSDAEDDDKITTIVALASVFFVTLRLQV